MASVDHSRATRYSSRVAWPRKKYITRATPAALDLTGFADFRVSTDTRIFLILQLIVIENTFFWKMFKKIFLLSE